jgi:hypothetical protein
MTTINLTAEHFLPVVGGSDDHAFVKSRKFMRGAGLFTSIGAFLLPILKSLGGYALSRTADFVKDTSTNLASGNSFKQSLKTSAQNAANRVGTDIRNKVTGGRITKNTTKRQIIDRQKKIRDIFAKF